MDAFLCEYSTIGALLIDPEAYPEAAELRPDDFLHPAFAAVFRAIQRRNDAGEPADVATVRDEAARECEGVTNDLLIQCMEVVSSSAVLPEQLLQLFHVVFYGCHAVTFSGLSLIYAHRSSFQASAFSPASRPSVPAPVCSPASSCFFPTGIRSRVRRRSSGWRSAGFSRLRT